MPEPVDAALLHLSGCSDVEVSNVKLVGANDYRDEDGYSKLNVPYEANHGIYLDECDDVTLTNIEVDSCYGDGLTLGGMTTTRNTNIVVNNFHVTSCGRHGAAFTNCDGVVIDDFTLVKGGTCGFDFEPNGANQGVLNVTITNFDLDLRTVPITAVSATKEVSGITLDGGIVRNGYVSWAIVLSDRGDGGRQSNWVVRNISHTYTLSSAVCATFTHTDDITIENCSFLTGTYSNRLCGVKLTDCGGTVTLTDNDFDTMPNRDVQEGPTFPTIVASGNTWQGGSD